MSENWAVQAWEQPWSPHVDPRSRWLDRAQMVWASLGQEVLLFGDGGYMNQSGATFAAQARAFGGGDQYWNTSDPVSDPVVSRLPRRYGYDNVTIHTAETCALVAALRWRRLGQWNMYVGDRSAVFQVMARLGVRDPCDITACCGSTLAARLFHLLAEIGVAWRDNAEQPSWRLHHCGYPDQWNVRIPDGQDPPKNIWR